MEDAGGAGAVNPAYVLVAWCMIFTAAFVQRPFQSLFPAICGEQGISPVWVGGVLFLHMLLQGVWGNALFHFPSWRYRRMPIALFTGRRRWCSPW